MSALVNYHAGGETNGLEQIGLQFLVPYQFYNVSLHGSLYAAPCIGYARWNLRELNSTTVCGGGGIIVRWPSQVELKAGTQLGATYFSSPPVADGNNWDSHFGIKVSIGYWLN